MANLEVGHIILWDNAATIPSGWSICDGTAGTPNLVSRFIRGASADAGGFGSGQVGTTGGATTHTHTYSSNTGTGGSHGHSVTGWAWAADSTNIENAWGNSGVVTSHSTHTHSGTAYVDTYSTTHTHTVSTSGTGTNLPAYIRLIYIMKTS